MTETTLKLEETNVITEDMRLPAGSTAIQCVLHHGENGCYLDVRAITVGTDNLDLNNPAHRFLQAVTNRIEEIMNEVSGGTGSVEALDPAEFEARLVEVNEGTSLMQAEGAKLFSERASLPEQTAEGEAAPA